MHDNVQPDSCSRCSLNRCNLPIALPRVLFMAPTADRVLTTVCFLVRRSKSKKGGGDEDAGDDEDEE